MIQLSYAINISFFFSLWFSFLLLLLTYISFFFFFLLIAYAIFECDIFCLRLAVRVYASFSPMLTWYADAFTCRCRHCLADDAATITPCAMLPCRCLFAFHIYLMLRHFIFSPFTPCYTIDFSGLLAEVTATLSCQFPLPHMLLLLITTNNDVPTPELLAWYAKFLSFAIPISCTLLLLAFAAWVLAAGLRYVFLAAACRHAPWCRCFSLFSDAMFLFLIFFDFLHLFLLLRYAAATLPVSFTWYHELIFRHAFLLMAADMPPVFRHCYCRHVYRLAFFFFILLWGHYLCCWFALRFTLYRFSPCADRCHWCFIDALRRRRHLLTRAACHADAPYARFIYCFVYIFAMPFTIWYLRHYLLITPFIGWGICLLFILAFTLHYWLDCFHFLDIDTFILLSDYLLITYIVYAFIILYYLLIVNIDADILMPLSHYHLFLFTFISIFHLILYFILLITYIAIILICRHYIGLLRCFIIAYAPRFTSAEISSLLICDELADDIFFCVFHFMCCFRFRGGDFAADEAAAASHARHCFAYAIWCHFYWLFHADFIDMPPPLLAAASYAVL